jgi:hypothetical protein
MKNMLTRTALVGSALLLGVSAVSAQTTVSGNLDLTFKNISSDVATGRNYRFFGKESQINLANKGKLSNGMDYAAGFSFELDGNDSNAPTAATNMGSFAENTYIDFIAGNTTITFGADHIQNPDKALSNLVGISDLDDAVSGVTAAAKAASATSFVTTANSAYQAYGVGVVQTVPGIGKVSLNYTPDRTTGLANGDTLGISTDTNLPATYDVGNSAYEIGFVGDFGIKGLNVEAFMNKSDAIGGSLSDLKGEMYGVRYNTGAITVAAQRSETTSIASVKLKSDSFGAAYAVTKDLSIGLSYGVTDKTATTVDEKIKQVSIGYNLGPVLVGASYAQVEDMGNVTSIDGDTLVFRASTKF